MSKSTLFLFWAVTAFGCAGKNSPKIEPSCCAPPPARSPKFDAESGDTAGDEGGGASDARAPDCTHLAPEDSTRGDFEKGKFLVASCDEACMKSLEGGKKRLEGLSLLRGAAEKGHLAAQAFYGRTKFTDLMTTRFEPARKDEYVEALYYLSLAARRGNTEAQSELPQLVTLALLDDDSFSEPLTEPLSQFDEVWVKAALEKAQRELSCFEE